MNPWPGKRVIVREAATGREVSATFDRTNGECVVFRASAGERYSITHAAE